ncbi:CvpA family protein [Filobacillus milosensis]|uniref:CvpA family protein n=1 Tax=Filobacillus milosensis TaxID=94137 RepID=A0A4Y8ISQ4_9BACI|nr:CvpA family protein [Filobacillus milosensis]TFB24978.1 CvpA family protein [Filobacillus milosensis]
MVSLILLILLILGFLIGLKRGFILQFLHLTGFITAFIIALLYFKELASRLELWIPYPDMTDVYFWGAVFNSDALEGAFYHGIAFFAIFFVVKIIMQIIANLLDFVAHLPILHSVNNLLGAIFGVVEMYVILFVLLFFASLIPVDIVQESLNQSVLASFIIEKTPIFSEQLKEKWFTNLE